MPEDYLLKYHLNILNDLLLKEGLMVNPMTLTDLTSSEKQIWTTIEKLDSHQVIMAIGALQAIIEEMTALNTTHREMI